MSADGAAHRGNLRLKAADRYLGIPAVAAVGLWRALRGRRAVPSSWRSIGLLKGAAIGDVVLLSAVVADLRAARPDARIVLFSGPSNDAFARLVGGADEVVELPVTDVPAALRRLRAARVDVLVDFGQWARLESLLAAGSGARCSIGFATPGQHRHLAFDVAVPHSDRVHEVENFRALLAPLGVPTGAPPRLVPRADGPPLAVPYAVLHVWPGGANSAERSWPEDHWTDLAARLHGRGFELVLTGGPGDVTATERLARGWRDRGMTVHTIAGSDPAHTLVWVAHAAGVVSVNTGLMHAAAAVGAPVVALNGPTSGRRWGPVGERVACVASPVVPDGYLNLGFERDPRGAGCMAAIRVDAVIGAWDSLVPDGEASRPPQR